MPSGVCDVKLPSIQSKQLIPVLVPAEALKAMEKVASHINEMQKIYEDYGAVFDQLVAEQAGHDKEVIPSQKIHLL